MEPEDGSGGPGASARITRSEIDELLRRADEARTRLRLATLELAAFGERLQSAREKADATRPR